MSDSSSLLPRCAAIREIAAAVADRTSFLLFPPRNAAVDMADALRGIEWVALLDNGQDTILRTQQPGAVAIAESFMPVGAVFLVPKTVPAAKISEALGHPIPEDGSQDLLMTSRPGSGELAWPTLFVEALEEAQPDEAVRLRTASLVYERGRN